MLTNACSQRVHTLYSPSPLGEHREPPLSWTHSPLDTTILNPHSPMAWFHPTTLDCNVLVELKTFSALSVDSLAPYSPGVEFRKLQVGPEYGVQILTELGSHQRWGQEMR